MGEGWKGWQIEIIEEKCQIRVLRIWILGSVIWIVILLMPFRCTSSTYKGRICERATCIYTRWPCHASLTHKCGCMDEESVFPTSDLTLLSVIIFTGRPFPHPTFTGARGAPKRHQGYIYSYHWVENSYQLFRKPWIVTNVGLLLILHFTPTNPCSYHC